MIIIKRFCIKYVVGGGGIIDAIGNLFRKLFTSDAARQLTSTALSVGKTAAKTAAKEVGKKAVDVGKTVAFDAGKKLTTNLLTQNSKDTLSRIINRGAENAVEIQDLVRRLNGGGVKNTNLKNFLL